jgi:putative endonuclease
MREFDYVVYIMTSKSRVLYTGITNNLSRRVFEHKTDQIEGFTKRYRVHRLVYFELYNYIKGAIAREKEIKRWVRQRRVALIESINPTWEDLAAEWFTPRRLAAEPDALVYDPSLIQTFSSPLRGEFSAPHRLPETKLRMRLQPSKVQSFGVTTSSKRDENKS